MITHNGLSSIIYHNGLNITDVFRLKMPSLAEHPWYVRTEKLREKYKEKEKWYERLKITVKAAYTYVRHTKERMDYKKQIKEDPVQVNVFHPKE